MTVSKGLLIGGIPVPYESAKLMVRQPTVRDLCLLTEEKFYTALEWLNFDKDYVLSDSDKKGLEDIDNFQLLLMILNGRVENFKADDIKDNILSLFFLLFPDKTSMINESGIVLFDNEDTSEYSIISSLCFKDFKDILNEIFPILKEDKNKYKVKSKKGKELAAKFERRKRKIAEMKANEKGKDNAPDSLIQEMVSILSIGNQISVNEILDNYTLYQLFYQYKRLRTKLDYEQMVSLRLAGAEDVEDTDHWLAPMSL